ncbi:hypothetical protein [Vibrio owensii]|uniref:hypothetical protein n=1 Tax=Vibrio owensii TaxID=696485 RepID=UPI004067888C
MINKTVTAIVPICSQQEAKHLIYSAVQYRTQKQDGDIAAPLFFAQKESPYQDITINSPLHRNTYALLVATSHDVICNLMDTLEFTEHVQFYSEFNPIWQDRIDTLIQTNKLPSDINLIDINRAPLVSINKRMTITSTLYPNGIKERSLKVKHVGIEFIKNGADSHVVVYNGHTLVDIELITPEHDLLMLPLELDDCFFNEFKQSAIYAEYQRLRALSYLERGFNTQIDLNATALE